MKYKDALLKYAFLGLGKKKNDSPSSWDPDIQDLTGTSQALAPEAIEEALRPVLRKHYARLLAAAYLRSTGKKLKKPETHVDPRITYAIARAANVRPSIAAQLDDEGKNALGGWSSNIQDMSPELLMDAVDAYNLARGKYTPTDKYESLSAGKGYGEQLQGPEADIRFAR